MLSTALRYLNTIFHHILHKAYLTRLPLRHPVIAVYLDQRDGEDGGEEGGGVTTHATNILPPMPNLGNDTYMYIYIYIPIHREHCYAHSKHLYFC